MKLFRRWFRRKLETHPIPLNGRVLIQREEDGPSRYTRRIGVVIATDSSLVSPEDRVLYYSGSVADHDEERILGFDLVLPNAIHAILPPREP